MTMTTYNRLFLLIFVLVATHPAQAEIYKWVDTGGETHYSERRPSFDLDVETITPTGVTAPAERQTWQARLESSDERRKDAQKQAETDAQAANDVAKMAHNCEQARIRLTSLERPRINRIDADGERIRMPEEERQSEMADARAYLGKNCR